MTIEIRRLVPDDWALYREVRLAALRDAPFAFGSTFEGESAHGEPVWRERLADRALFVALDAEHAAGLAAGARNRNRPEEALLISMWTAPAFRGQGVGETLVQSVLAWTAAEGISRITLEVTEAASLDDPDLVPARVAQAEGISERYLQKLFETVGDNFTHYVRERRLQRAWADLSNPVEAHRSISEIAYAYGFGDSAHFSRAFRHRFGLPPREFRQQEAERASSQHGVAGQRGWPQEALAQLRVHPSVEAALKRAWAKRRPS